MARKRWKRLWRRFSRRFSRRLWPRERSVNIRYLAVTIVVAVSLPCALVALHAIQSPRNAKALLGRALDLQNAGKTDEAVVALRLYLGSHPADNVARRRLGLILAAENDARSAIEARDILLTLHSQKSDDVELGASLLRLLLRMGYLSDAQKIADGMKSLPDNDTRCWQLLSETYQSIGRLNDALAAIRHALSSDPANLAVQAQYLPLLYRTTLKQAVLEDAIQRMLSQTDQPALAELLAYSVLRNLDLPGASEHLRRALQLSPDNIDVLLTAATDAVASQPDKAGMYLAKAYRLAPKDARVLLAYGKWLHWTGQFQKALPLFQEGYKRDEEDKPDFAWRAAETLIELGRNKELHPYLSTLLDHRNYLPAYHFARGRSAMVEGNLEEAENHLATGSRLLKWVPREFAPAGDHDEWDFKLHLARSGVAYRRGDLKAATQWANVAHELLPRDSIPLVTLGQLYYEQGNYDRSARVWRDALEAPYHPPGAVFGLAQTLLAQVRQQPASDRNIQPILDLLETARRSIPNDPNIPLVEADAWWAVGDLEKAKRTLVAAMQSHPRNRQIALTWIRVLVADRRFDEAEKAVEVYEKSFGRDFGSVLAAASLLIPLNKFDDALSLLESSESILPGDTLATLRRLEGQVLWLANRTADAGARFNQARLMDPEDDVAWLYYWIWLVDQKRDADAKSLIAETKRTRGDSTPVWRWAEAITDADAHWAAPSNALPKVGRALDDLRHSHPFRWETYHLQGVYAELSGRPKEAATEYLRAISDGPDPPSLVARTIPLLVHLGRLADAEGVLELVRQQRLPLPGDNALQAELARLRGDRAAAP